MLVGVVVEVSGVFAAGGGGSSSAARVGEGESGGEAEEEVKDLRLSALPVCLFSATLHHSTYPFSALPSTPRLRPQTTRSPCIHTFSNVNSALFIQSATVLRYESGACTIATFVGRYLIPILYTRQTMYHKVVLLLESCGI